MENLEIFGFRALWSPYYLTCIVIAAALYLLLVTKGKHRATVKEKTLFLTGLVLLYAVKGSPIDLMGHIMFSAHMAQMAVLYLVIPLSLLQDYLQPFGSGSFKHQVFKLFSVCFPNFNCTAWV